MIKESKLIYLILISLIGTLLLAGGPALAQESSPDISLKDVQIHTGIGDLIKNFDSLKYSIILKRDDNKIQDSIIEYQYHGKEKIQDVETDKVSFKITNKMSEEEDMPSSMILWIENIENNEIKQMEVDGETIPTGMGEKMAEVWLQPILLPFRSLKEINLQEVKEWGEVTRSQETVAGKEVDIFEIQLENIPEANFDSATGRIAKFEDFSMVIGYDYVSSKENMDIQFNIEKLVLR